MYAATAHDLSSPSGSAEAGVVAAASASASASAIGSAPATSASAPATSADAKPALMPRDRIMLLVTGLAGSLLIGLTGQFVGSNISNIAGGVAATADEASWLSTAYTMSLFAGIVVSVPLIPALGLRRYMALSALLFALAALGCAAAPPLPAMVALRALQGFAAGGFGPIAFVAVFMTTGGPRLPFGLSLLAFILLLPTTFGPAASGFLEDSLGWEALFLVQAMVGAALLAAAVRWMPRSAVSREALRRDWMAVLLLCIALAASVLVLSQGTRRYWLESDLIGWSIAAAIGAWVGFAFTVWRSPLPIIDVRLLARPAFITPITLNLLFRAGFAATAFLIPQFLLLVNGYRPLELAELFLAAAIAQLLAFPVVWWLMQHIDGRIVIAAGLLSFGLAVYLVADNTSLAAAPEFRLPLALAAAAQVMFLVPNLVAGAGPLKPSDGPTASLMFNATTTGGTTLGVALATELVTERQKFHSAILTEAASALAPRLDRLDALAAGFASRLTDDAVAGGRALALATGALRRQTWVLSFNDALLLAAALLILGAAGALLLSRQPPLRKSSTPPAGDPS